jgi:hypothetical protein
MYLMYQSLDQLLVQYIIQVVHSRTIGLMKYKRLQQNNNGHQRDYEGGQNYM